LFLFFLYVLILYFDPSQQLLVLLVLLALAQLVLLAEQRLALVVLDCLVSDL
jgi:hypothetical protein